jgi:anthranilate phosphoribosyltransferase
MDFEAAFERVAQGGTLTREESRRVFAGAIRPSVDALALARLLQALARRGETGAEIAGAAEELRASMIVFEHDHPDAIDTAGTGGDGLGSFNLSTAAAIVAAAAGARVIKHGNRNQSSRCGSADLLEAAGLPLDLAPECSRRVLDRVGITFLFAPAYHPGLRHAAPVRKSLGIRTLFNYLGPLCNPGRVERQLVGVPEERRTRDIAGVLAELGAHAAYVVHGAGGADELTLAGRNRVEHVGHAPRCSFDACDVGASEADVGALAGGDAAHNLRLLRSVLEDEPSPLLDAVVLNASAALVLAGRARSAAEGAALARDALRSRAASATFSRWIELARAKETAA